MSTTEAHFQKFRLNATLQLWVPAHEPREEDPHYAAFHAVKRRVKAADTPCWRCGVHYADLGKDVEGNPMGSKQLELHHKEVEFSVQAGIDIDKFNADHGMHLDEDSFLAFLEGDGNLLQLCDVCHRSNHDGIHFVPEPLWKVRRWWRKGQPDFIQKPQ